MRETIGSEPKIRQVVLVSLNESVTLLSYYEDESIDYLVKKALRTMQRIKGENDRK